MGRLIRHGHKAYLVGGCVRDLMLGYVPKDFDVVTDARPEQMRSLFRNSRLIGRRFRLVHVFFRGGEIIEVSTFRRGAAFDPDSDGPLLDENTYGTASADAFRRDLTINGLFYDLETFAIYDYVGGMQDLKDGIIRIIGDPRQRIREDPIRMIRAIRHAAGTGFTIEPNTLAAIQELAGEILKANPSRLRDEFLRELTDGHAAGSIDLMMQTGLLYHLMTTAREVYAAQDSEAARAHLRANLTAVDEVVRSRKGLPLAVVLAALLSPMVKAQNVEAKAPNARNRRSHIQYFMRDFVKPILRELGVGKAEAERTAMLLLGVKTIQRTLSKGPTLPKAILKKAYFPDALMLYQLEAVGRNERLPRILAELAQSRQILLFKRLRSRRGPRRRQGSRGGDKPLSQTNPQPTAVSSRIDPELKFVAKPDDAGKPPSSNS